MLEVKLPSLVVGAQPLLHVGAEVEMEVSVVGPGLGASRGPSW